MMQGGDDRWWRAGVRATAIGGLLALAAAFLLPGLALRYEAPLLAGLAAHRHLLYAIAGLMATVGWVDSVLRYRARVAPRPGP